MSTIKSSAENLTLNADGANNDVIIQSNGSTKVTVDGATGGVGIGVTPETWQSTYKMVDVNASASFGGHSSYFTYMGNNWYVDASGNHKYKNTSFATRYYQDSSGKHHFQTAPSGTADAGVTLTTKATIDTDGLKFNGDTAAANALDDYEEGTFTVTSSDSGGSFYSSGHYVKVGGIVHIRAYFGDIAGGVSFAGLPFAAEASTSFAIHQMYQVNWPASAKQLVCYASGSNIVFGWQTDTGTGLSPTSTDTAHSSCTFGIAGTYKTTA